MNAKDLCEGDERWLNWLISFKLPNYWKKIGVGVFIISLVLVLSIKFLEGNFDLLKNVLEKAMLIGLLIITISREIIEDEFIQNLRSKSFSFAFIIGVVFVLIQPLVNYIAFLLFKPGKLIFQDLGDFMILWFLLIVYLTTFWSLKRRAS